MTEWYRAVLDGRAARDMPPDWVLPWLRGVADAAEADDATVGLGPALLSLHLPPPPAGSPTYVVTVGGRERELPPDWVLPWVHGMADFHAAASHLLQVAPGDPEDTRRVHALQIGDAQGWFVYRYPRREAGG